MQKLSAKERAKQELYRDARTTNKYDDIWQSVNKCVYCDLSPKYIFFEENGIVMTINLYAYIDGHFIVVPRRHVRSAKELSQLEWDTIRKFIYIAKKLIKEVHGIKGMQLVQKDGVDAQATVEHLHFHCVPFDSPDLTTWNYRKLKYTPLENVNLYKKAAKTIINSDQRFEKKYKNYSSLPLACDLIILNDKKQILFEVRSKNNQLVPNFMTLPGGVVNNFQASFEDELAREVFEETGIKVRADQLKLILSRTGQVKYLKTSEPLGLDYTTTNKFIWNTYLLKDFDANTKLTPGDDCGELLWVDVKEIRAHKLIPEKIKLAVNKAIYE